MTTIVTRAGKGSPLTWNEADANFINLNTDKFETNYTASGIGAVERTTQSKLDDIISIKDFGAVGDGVTDDTAAIQAAMDAAQGKVLIFDGNKTYCYTSLIVKEKTTLITYGATLNRLLASTSPGVTIEGGVTVDALVITTPGGASGDKAVWINGSNVAFDRLSITAAAQGVYNSTNYGVEIESNPSGTLLSNITIRNFYCKYVSAALFAKNVAFLTVDGALIEYYRLGVYLRDVSNSTLTNVVCRYTASSSYGAAGENGLLVESSISTGYSHDLTFNNWEVIDSGEHSYRLGGQLKIRNVWFNNCSSRNSGSSIVVNNPAATIWNGGCGFKILGGTATFNEWHTNIFLTDCVVQDINPTTGTFPTGHGINNFTPFLIIGAYNVHLTNCSTSVRNVTYVARYGVLMTACDGVYLTNCAIRNCEGTALKPYEELTNVSYPYQNYPVENLVITGGVFETSPSGIPFYFSEVAAHAHKNWDISGALFKGGIYAMRIETAGAGSFTNLNFKFTYVESSVDDATYTTPVINGAVYAKVDVNGPWRPAAYNPTVLNGSIWYDSLTNIVTNKTNDVWHNSHKYYRVVIDNDSFKTIVPPKDTAIGFILITGLSTTRHMMSWFRASSSPAGTKYAGGAAAVIVTTALTGTTGTVGNLTVGIQDNLIYIENRSGASETYNINFM